jgi:hypothetical protein
MCTHNPLVYREWNGASISNHPTGKTNLWPQTGKEVQCVVCSAKDILGKDLNGWVGGWMDGWMDNWVDGKVDVWVGGWMDGYIR